MGKRAQRMRRAQTTRAKWSEDQKNDTDPVVIKDQQGKQIGMIRNRADARRIRLRSKENPKRR